ncbi:hypothetical protein MLD38_020042 [Melastoma candidum]|uniref:Uncharacterized protein n=1 Tax=Melastoma candidum TaxID=119954 RepID=A0ACB9QEN5_9MYRT|nr:hypothetical protein MLD38_020042 [Melastoma candidum]
MVGTGLNELKEEQDDEEVGKILQEWESREFGSGKRVDESSGERMRPFQESSDGRYNGLDGGSYTPVSLPIHKLDFLDFDGANLDDWLYISERYFELEQTRDDQKVRIASVFMYRKALQWHYTFIKNRGGRDLPSWGEYIDALTARFGKTVFDDPMGALKNLKQEGSCENMYVYMEEFDACLRRVLEKVDLPEEFQCQNYFNGCTA